MSQEYLTTTESGESDLLQHLGLLRLRNLGSIKVGSLSILISLELLEPLLVVKPLVGQYLSTGHTANRNNHRTYISRRIRRCQILMRSHRVRFL